MKLTCEEEPRREINGGAMENANGKEPGVQADRLGICFMDTVFMSIKTEKIF